MNGILYLLSLPCLTLSFILPTCLCSMQFLQTFLRVNSFSAVPNLFDVSVLDFGFHYHIFSSYKLYLVPFPICLDNSGSFLPLCQTFSTLIFLTHLYILYLITLVSALFDQLF